MTDEVVETPPEELHVLQTIDLQLKGNNLIEIITEIAGCSLKNCLDTGSSRNFLKTSFILLLEDRIGQKVKRKALPRPCKVQLGNEATLFSWETVELPVKIHKDNYLVSFHVLDKLLYDLILGMEFILKYDAAIRASMVHLVVLYGFVVWSILTMLLYFRKASKII